MININKYDRSLFDCENILKFNFISIKFYLEIFHLLDFTVCFKYLCACIMAGNIDINYTKYFGEYNS